MNWNNIKVALAVLLIGVGFYFFELNKPTSVNVPTVANPLNATYVIEGQSVTLVNGKAEVDVAPGSATKIATTVFGGPVRGDLNGDGKEDMALMLVQNPGGSGTFYYVATAINDDGVKGTNAILLGDRIAPQNISIKNGQIMANYADRNPREPMTMRPSLGVTKYMAFDGTKLNVVIQPIASVGEFCGGNMTTAPLCVAGSHCAPNPKSNLPFGDVGGTCVLDTN